MLFLFSCLLLPIRRLDRGKTLEKLPAWAVFLLFLPLWGSSQVLNVPVLTMYRFGIYLAAFLMGYFILSHKKIQRELERFRLPLAGQQPAEPSARSAGWGKIIQIRRACKACPPTSAPGQRYWPFWALGGGI